MVKVVGSRQNAIALWGAWCVTILVSSGQDGGVPRVVVPTGSKPVAPVVPAAPMTRMRYPWKTHITCTVFWVGEDPGPRNPTTNHKSSWDQNWMESFGGTDDPDPAQRVANHATGDFRPKAFIPKQNPFYVALPYNDVLTHNSHKPEASRVIPWFARRNPQPGKTVLKGQWVQIFRAGRNCFAQWEDCGPWNTDDWEYVFGTAKQPKTKENGSAGIDLSPAIRDYLGLKSGDKVHWRFVEPSQVPSGPWKKYGGQTLEQPGAADMDAQRRYLDDLRRLRDEQFLKKPLSDL